MVKSIYRSLYDSIRADITSETYPFQSLLPTEAELCERFGCSHSTVRRALSELARDGYVQARQGRGVTVIWQPETRETYGYATGGLETFPETCAARGLSPTTELLTFERLVADKTLAVRIGFEAGTNLVHMVRLRIASGTPVALEDTYTSADEIPGITPEVAVRGTYAHIEGTLGLKILTSKRLITMQRANDDDTRLLHVEPGSYIGCVVSQSFDSNGIMFERIESHQIPEFFSARLVVTRPSATA